MPAFLQGKCNTFRTGQGPGELATLAQLLEPQPIVINRLRHLEQAILCKLMIMKRIALFPGSFDPFTAGHLNILKRALTMFDEVVIAIGVNIDKRGFFPNEKRIDIIRQATAGLEGVSIVQYDKLTIDLCKELGIKHIVRGVRNMIDFETERSIADANRKLAPEIETIIIPTAQEFAHISSTAVRDLLKHGGDTSLFVPEGVEL